MKFTDDFRVTAITEELVLSRKEASPQHSMRAGSSHTPRGPGEPHLFCWFMFLFFFENFFWRGPFLKPWLNLLQHCFCFTFRFFGCEACGISAPQPGIEPSPPALEGGVVTTGPPGKSLERLDLFFINFYWSIVALHCCVSLYCTAKWISCMYTSIPSFLDFLPM